MLQQPFVIDSIDWLIRYTLRSGVFILLLFLVMKAFHRTSNRNRTRILAVTALVLLSFVAADIIAGPMSETMGITLNVSYAEELTGSEVFPYSFASADSRPEEQEALHVDISEYLSSIRGSETTTILTILIFIWLLGVSVNMVRMAVRLMYGFLVLCRARPVNLKRFISSRDKVKGVLGMTAQVELHFSDDVPVPLVINVLKPVIILPSSSAGWSEDRIYSAIKHEMIHIRHHDLMIRILWQFLSALLWFLPPVARAGRRHSELMEKACDEEVVAPDMPAQVYALHLVTLLREHQPQKNALLRVSLAADHSLAERVRHVLSLEHDTRKKEPRRLSWNSVGIMLAVGLLLLVTDLRKSHEETDFFSYRESLTVVDASRAVNYVNSLPLRPVSELPREIIIEKRVWGTYPEENVVSPGQFEEILLKHPVDEHSWRWLSWLYLEENNYEKAKLAAARSLALEPYDSLALLAYSCAQYGLNNHAEGGLYLDYSLASGLELKDWMRSSDMVRPLRNNELWNSIMLTHDKNPVRQMEKSKFLQVYEPPEKALLPAPTVDDALRSIARVAFFPPDSKTRFSAIRWLQRNGSVEAEQILLQLYSECEEEELRERIRRALEGISSRRERKQPAGTSMLTQLTTELSNRGYFL